MDNTSKLPEISQEIQTAIKFILDHFELEDQSVRERQIRQWRQLKLYWEGIQKIWYDDVAHDWKIYDQEATADDNDAAYYDKPINVFRAYLESIIAALSINIPGVACSPEDVDNPLDIDTSKAGDKIYKLISKHNDVSLLWLHALFTFVTEGLVGCYRYSKEDESFGTYEVPIIEKVDQESYLCPECQAELDPSLFLGANSIKEEGLIEEPIICPSCGYEVPETLEPTKSKIDRVKKFDTKNKSRQILEVFGGLYIKVPNYARKQSDIPYLIYIYETHYSNVMERYPFLRDKLKVEGNGGALGSENTYEVWGRLSPEYRSEMPNNTVTVRNIWLRPSAYWVAGIEQTKELQRKYPKGCRAVFVNDIFCEALEEKLDDHWTLIYNPLADYVHFNPLGLLLVSVQDITNDLTALTLQTIEQGITQTFVDPSVVNLKAYGQKESAPGSLYPTIAQPSNKSISEGFFQLKAASLSPEVMPFGTEIQNLGQQASGAVPALWGGIAEAGSKTASEYSMSRAQALQRLQNTWKMFTSWWRIIFSKAIPAYMLEMVDDEMFTEKGINGNWQKVLIRKAETQGKIGEVTLEVSDNIPLTLLQKKDVLIQLMQFATVSPELVALISAPENIPYIKEALGLEELKIPGEDYRQKQYEEIQELIVSEPIVTEPDPMMMQQAMMQGMQPPPPQELPSVPVDPIIDNHLVEADITRGWLISDLGRQAKIDNPNGYKNVLLHLIEHLKYMQPATANVTGSDNPGSLPKVAQEGNDDVSNLPVQ